MIVKSVATKNHQYEACSCDITIDDDLRFIVKFDSIQILTKKDLNSTVFAATQEGHFCQVNGNSQPGSQNGKNNNNNASQGNKKKNSKSATDLIENHQCCTKKSFQNKLQQHFTYNDKLHISKMTKLELSTLLKRIVPCVGCRNSVETMYDVLLSSGKEKYLSEAATANIFEIFTGIYLDFDSLEMKLNEDFIKNDKADVLYWKGIFGGVR